MPPNELKAHPALAGLLRLMEAQPNVARRLPKYRPDDSWPSALCTALREVREEFPAALLPDPQLLPWAYWTFAPRTGTDPLAEAFPAFKSFPTSI